ncbi:hypothetical protein ACNQGB_01680 [Flavobacterium sp. XS1P32]|uniref:hypothetical protein n=1 Tax=unclassified Flavobacterium TaxID=196869 RepID=UPI00286C2B3E|nr:hypothetical protein [Flavobacterium sp.]
MKNYLKSVLLILFLSVTFLAFGQNSDLIITPQIKIPTDSIAKKYLIENLKIFIQDIENGNVNSGVIAKVHLFKYKDYFDIFNNIQNSDKYGTRFFKPYLKNIVLQSDRSYKIDISYFGIDDKNQILNRINFSVIAKSENGNFNFYCPFEENVKNWNYKKQKKITFHFDDNFNKENALKFEKYNAEIAKKLNLSPIAFGYYKCKDIQEVYKLLGIDYFLQINGDVRSSWILDKGQIFISGTNLEEYNHDLTHLYFERKFGNEIRNWTAEEGYNIYTTDYWGRKPSEIFELLENFIKENPDKSLYEVFQKNNILQHPIRIKFPISAIFMRKLEREKGFDKVLELICSGKTDDNYYKLLDKYLKVNKDNFDQIVKQELQKK